MPDEDVVLDAVYHIHTYNNTLKYDEDSHFYECTYGADCVDLLHSRKNVVPHTFGYICDI